MIAAIRDHQRKSFGIRDALRSEGWWVMPAGAPADILLIDADIDRPTYRDTIEIYQNYGVPVVLYPHGPAAMLIWDGIFEPYPVDACLVVGEGQRQAMKAYGYPYPIEVMGWSLCDQLPFRPCTRQPRVLFAAQHPLGNGYLMPEFKHANRKAFQALRNAGVELTVRHVGPLEASGLQREPDVEYVPGRLTVEPEAVDDYDLVVARDTFLFMAVARGVPAVTFHQDGPLRNDPESPNEPAAFARSAGEYQDLLRYPWDLKDPEALELAMESEASDWREVFIGEQLDAAWLSGLLKKLCRAPVGV